MAGLTCPNHPDQESVVGVMFYGPEGATTDMCGTCLLEWAVAIVEGAGATVVPPGPGAAQTAQEAANGSAGTGGRRRGRRRQEEPVPATEEAESEPVASGEVEGA